MPASKSRLAALLFVASLTLLILLDQHRFQPWAYQFGIVAIVLAFAPAGRAASLLRVLTVGIYFWSAVSKFDYSFLHGLGPELLRGLLAAFRLEPGWMQPEVATTLAWSFPIDELVTAILLAIRRTRTIGLVAAIAMHVLLLATLGPLGLDHSPGVLLWNVYFIGQNLLLFRQPLTGWKATAGPNARKRFRDILRGFASPGPSAGIANVVVFAAVWLPILHPFGYLDYWPAWAVYAPAGERVSLSLPFGSELTPDVQPYFQLRTGPSFPSGSRLDLWSLDALSVPLYPGDRFATGVSLAVIEHFDVKHSAEMTVDLKYSAWTTVESQADRFTGERSKQVFPPPFPGESGKLREYADSFYLNALPRKLGGW